MQHNSINQDFQRTQSAFTWTYLLTGPFWGVYTLIPYILFRDLDATAWQIAIVFALKPIVSLLSFFWSASVHRRPDRLKTNIISAGMVAYLPFLFFPWVDNPWFYVVVSGMYMLMVRGVMPAWMEIIKRNIPGISRQRVFAKSTSLYYIGSMTFPLAAGWMMDVYSEAWRYIFPATAILALSAILFQMRIPISTTESITPLPLNQESLRSRLIEPLQKVIALLKNRRDFFHFQGGFMLGGFALMVMQPVLPEFFLEVLNLSYVELSVALTCCKGIAFVLMSPLWARLMDRWDLFKMSGLVTFFACLFPLGLWAAQWHLAWVFVAYLLYGGMQAGSEMTWNLSGPLFAKEEDSSLYSGVNVLTVGIRGCVAPFLGGALGYFGGVSNVFCLAGLLCLIATLHMFLSSRKYSESTVSLESS